MKAAKNPEELRKLINTAPQELKYVLPDNGNFNIAQWDKDRLTIMLIFANEVCKLENQAV